MKRLIYLFIFLTSILQAWSQHEDVRITHFSEADGFGQDIVSFALQDNYGYVWLGTWNGLCRYDGYRFHNYRMRPGDGSGLRTNRIATIRELASRDLECTTSDSLTFVFHRQTGRFELSNGNYDQRPRPFKADSLTEARVRSLPTDRKSVV